MTSTKKIIVTKTEKLIVRSDSNNCTDSVGWCQTPDGQWTALTHVDSKTFKTEAGARRWYLARAGDKARADLAAAGAF